MSTGVSSGWSLSQFLAVAPSCASGTVRSLPSALKLTPPSLPTMTSARVLGRLVPLPTEGRFTELGVSMGAVTMKMMSSTSITSMNGTMLISFMERRRVPLREAIAGMPCLPSMSRGRTGVRAQVALQDVGELLDEGLLVDGHAVDVAREAVVGDHGRNGGEQADGGGHQGLGDAGRHGGQRHLLHAGKAREGVHDAPHGAEQAHVGRH